MCILGALGLITPSQPIVLLLPNTNHKAREVYFFFGTLAFALAAGASVAGGLAPLFCMIDKIY
jgi:hypothetical protein